MGKRERWEGVRRLARPVQLLLWAVEWLGVPGRPVLLPPSTSVAICLLKKEMSTGMPTFTAHFTFPLRSGSGSLFSLFNRQ